MWKFICHVSNLLKNFYFSGMLKQNGKVLKPTTKPMCAEREMRFYEELQTSTDPVLQAMRAFTPGYHGIKQLPINGQLVDCIVLDDLTNGLREPCIMDIKIGQRTWDPLATEDKMKNEQVYFICIIAQNRFVRYR